MSSLGTILRMNDKREFILNAKQLRKGPTSLKLRGIKKASINTTEWVEREVLTKTEIPIFGEFAPAA